MSDFIIDVGNQKAAGGMMSINREECVRDMCSNIVDPEVSENFCPKHYERLRGV